MGASVEGRDEARDDDGLDVEGAAFRVGRSTVLVGALTLCSRVSGVVRDAVLAVLLGASLLNDLFQLCFELPNLARRALGDSAFAPLVLPLHRRVAAEGGGGARGALCRQGTLFFLGVGVAIAAVAVLAAPLVVRALLPAAAALEGDEAGRLVLARAAALVRIASLYFVFLLAAAFVGALLQAEHRFVLPALGGLPLNLLLIGVGAVALSRLGTQGAGDAAALLADPAAWTLLVVLASSIAIAGALRLGMLVLGAMRLPRGASSGAAPRLWGELRALLRRAGPMLFVLAVPQLHVSAHLVILALAPPPGESPEGLLSLLRYAHRIMEFPLALIAGALATTVLPAIFASRGEGDGAVAAPSPLAVARGVRDALARFATLALPASAGLALLATPAVALLFQRGAWDAAASAACGRFLVFYAVALVPLGAGLVIMPVALAVHGVRAHLRNATVGLLLTAAASALFYRITGEPAALALGIVVGETWRVLRTLRTIHRPAFPQGDPAPTRPSFAAGVFVPVVGGALVMSAAIVALRPHLLPAELVTAAPTLPLAGGLLSLTGLGIAVYAAMLALLRRLVRRA